MDRTLSYFQDKAVLITGASSGIGEELAWQLAQARAKLTLAARRRERLESVAQRITALGNARPLVAECDVTRAGDIERAVAETVHNWGKLDVVFANAGFAVVGALKQLSLEDYRRQFETNVFGVLRTAYAALPEIEKTKGNLVLISSVSGWVSTPGTSAYSMSKFAIRALGNSITQELSPAGVKVTLISPGFVVSNIRRVDKQGRFHPEARDRVPAWIQMSTQRAVRKILEGVARGKREQIITLHGKVFVALERFLPWVNRAMTAKISLASRR
ncbi:MAG TPA: SDR family NAD(P)-dependent oxidoreductase [Candidatus Acidoferrales bacterium]|nr:SDR family NAD(P)-dependent oxidoreductase [Candidatus Acidoferrales bacterium]